MKTVRIGVVGTFDVDNFGDLLFPLLAKRELQARIPEAELRYYSYRQKSAAAWPYDVHALDRLVEHLPDLDLLVVGGGFLVRFDKDIAPGYAPPSPDLQHPTAYWLMPTLLAEVTGVPVAWNSLSTSSSTPAWAAGLLELAVRSATYVSVRDQTSRDELLGFAPGADVHLVADIGFGAGSLLPDEPSADYERFCQDNELEAPYIVVQPSPFLVEHGVQIDAALRGPRAAGYTVLELPISPVLGDRCGLLSLERETVQPRDWPHPLLLAEIVARSEAVIARSLHLSVVALATGVPVHRHGSALDLKYAPLATLPGVHYWEDRLSAVEILETGLGRTQPGPEIADRLGEVEAHWDAIAATIGQTPAPGSQVGARLISTATAALEQLGGELLRAEAEANHARTRIEGLDRDLRAAAQARYEAESTSSEKAAAATEHAAALDAALGSAERRVEELEHALEEAQLELAWPGVARRLLRAARSRRSAQ